MNLLFLDTETTGLDAIDRVCQVAFQVRGDNEVRSVLCKPPLEISKGAMAVSHITNAMVENTKPFEETILAADLDALLSSHVLVAHNAPFDIGMLEKEGLQVHKHICTKKVAKAIGGASQHNMQYLRYLLDVEVPADAIAHTADGDVRVLAGLFDKLEEHMSVEEMIKLCN